MFDARAGRILDGCSCSIAHWAIREPVKAPDAGTALPRAREKPPQVHSRIISSNGFQGIFEDFKVTLRQ
ncbi:MAG: hypothetical protein M2R45_01564 [Verrucomicrobia subdivision 3 bacterium]|nr:hypothetical protein [Limisphaerales bacterium]MCS1413308.1 hypothetical protein [Limisphaerales bacterium]